MNDYLTECLPVLYAELGLTGEEIAHMTPWEVEQRIRGYDKRLKNRKAFMASFVTAPVINSGIRGPKKPITAESLVPDAFKKGVTVDEKRHIIAYAEEMERRRAHGRT